MKQSVIVPTGMFNRAAGLPTDQVNVKNWWEQAVNVSKQQKMGKKDLSIIA